MENSASSNLPYPLFYAGTVFHRAGGRANIHYLIGAQQRMNVTYYLSHHPKYQDALVRQEGRRFSLNPHLNSFVDTHSFGCLTKQSGEPCLI